MMVLDKALPEYAWEIQQCLLARLCHDLASPTTALSLAIDSLTEGSLGPDALPPDQREMAHHARESLGQLVDTLATVRGLFGSSKGMAGAVSPSLKKAGDTATPSHFVPREHPDPKIDLPKLDLPKLDLKDAYWEALKRMGKYKGLQFQVTGDGREPSRHHTRLFLCLKRVVGMLCYHLISLDLASLLPPKTPAGGQPVLSVRFTGTSGRITLFREGNLGSEEGGQEAPIDLSFLLPPGTHESVTKIPELTPRTSLLWYSWLLMASNNLLMSPTPGGLEIGCPAGMAPGPT